MVLTQIGEFTWFEIFFNNITVNEWGFLEIFFFKLVMTSKRHLSKLKVFSILCNFIMENLTNDQCLEIVEI